MDEKIDSKICLYCGSRNLYRDHETDNLVCNDCHSQSQALSQRETAEEDGMAISNRQRMHQTKRSIKKSLRRLPSLELFVTAYFYLIEKATLRSLELLPNIDLHDMNPNYKKNIIMDAKELFILYLERWNDAANYYMVRNPGLRISMRDRLIPGSIRNKIFSQLVYNSEHGLNIPESNLFMTQIAVKSTGLLDELTPKRKPRTPKRVKFTDEVTETDLKISAKFKTTAKKTQELDSKVSQSKMLKSKVVGWREKILSIDVNPNLVTAIVYIAHLGSRTGLTSNLLIAWSNDNEYDFAVNLFPMLEKKYRKSLLAFESSFQLSAIPDPQEIDVLVSKLISCFDVRNRKKGDYLRSLYIRNKAMIRSAQSRQQKIFDESLLQIHHKKTFYNVGLTVFHLCSYLGLKQMVLDFTYALMGFPTSHRDIIDTNRLPPALRFAHPGFITSPIQILAVIVVACKFCPGWEKWKVFEVTGSIKAKANKKIPPGTIENQSADESDSSYDSENDNSDVSFDDSHCIRTRRLKPRLGVQMSDYFNNTLSYVENKNLSASKETVMDELKFRVASGERLEGFQDISFDHVNGLSYFLVHESDLPVPWNEVRIHPSYRLILEYISRRLFVNVQKLFQHTMALDGELERYCNHKLK